MKVDFEEIITLSDQLKFCRHHFLILKDSQLGQTGSQRESFQNHSRDKRRRGSISEDPSSRPRRRPNNLTVFWFVWAISCLETCPMVWRPIIRCFSAHTYSFLFFSFLRLAALLINELGEPDTNRWRPFDFLLFWICWRISLEFSFMFLKRLHFGLSHYSKSSCSCSNGICCCCCCCY